MRQIKTQFFDTPNGPLTVTVRAGALGVVVIDFTGHGGTGKSQMANAVRQSCMARNNRARVLFRADGMESIQGARLIIEDTVDHAMERVQHAASRILPTLKGGKRHAA